MTELKGGAGGGKGEHGVSPAAAQSCPKLCTANLQYPGEAFSSGIVPGGKDGGLDH